MCFAPCHSRWRTIIFVFTSFRRNYAGNVGVPVCLLHCFSVPLEKFPSRESKRVFFSSKFRMCAWFSTPSVLPRRTTWSSNALVSFGWRAEIYADYLFSNQLDKSSTHITLTERPSCKPSCSWCAMVAPLQVLVGEQELRRRALLCTLYTLCGLTIWHDKIHLDREFIQLAIVEWG